MTIEMNGNRSVTTPRLPNAAECSCRVMQIIPGRWLRECAALFEPTVSLWRGRPSATCPPRSLAAAASFPAASHCSPEPVTLRAGFRSGSTRREPILSATSHPRQLPAVSRRTDRAMQTTVMLWRKTIVTP